MATAIVLPPLIPDIPQDNMQDLLRRKREIEKNKYRYHLTEADCNLILTNANEYTFADGQVIMEEGHENSSIYRIKSGAVSLNKKGRIFCELSQGWFIGETLLLDNKTHDIIEASLIAKGPVTLAEVNILFVKKLFDVDRILALKFYRNLASRLSSIFFAISGNLMSPCIAKMFQEAAAKAAALALSDQSLSSSSSSSPSSLSSSSSHSASSLSRESSSTSSLDSQSSSSSLSSSGSASELDKRDINTSNSSSTSSSSSSSSLNIPVSPKVVACSNVPQASVEVVNRRRRLSKRKSISIARATFKMYILETDGKGVRTARIKNKKINIITEAFGFKHKTTINFHKIKNIVKTSDTSVTIIFDPLKAKTLFLKTTAEAEEFYGLAQSLAENSSKTNVKSTPSTPLSHAVSETSLVPPNPLARSVDNYFLPLGPHDDAEQRALDKEVMYNIATRLELKKGDVLMAEGDLFQRIYTITKGECETVKDDKVISTIREGEVFGEASLLHLRPAPVTIRIASEIASVLVIPAYKLQELISSNPILAVRIYKKTAALVEKKIDRVIALKHKGATEMFGKEFAKNLPERINL